MKRIPITLTVAVLAVLLLATPGLVAARGGHGGGGQGGLTSSVQGTIASKSCDDGYITVLVTSPESLASEDPLTVLVTGDTRFKQCDPVEGAFRISCGALTAEAEVKAAGTVIDGDYVANSVIQY